MDTAWRGLDATTDFSRSSMNDRMYSRLVKRLTNAILLEKKVVTTNSATMFNSLMETVGTVELMEFVSLCFVFPLAVRDLAERAVARNVARGWRTYADADAREAAVLEKCAKVARDVNMLRRAHGYDGEGDISHKFLAPGQYLIDVVAMIDYDYGADLSASKTKKGGSHA
jgi:hypothetical protein